MTQYSTKADIPYAELTDPPNMQTYSLGLATQLDGVVCAKYALLTDLAANNPSPTAGDQCYVGETDITYQYSSVRTAWISLSPIFKYKTADTTRSSVTSTSSDTHLQFAAEGSAIYEFEANLAWDFVGAGGGGFLVNFTIPTSGKVSYTSISGATTATSFNSINVNAVGESLDVSGSISGMSGWDSQGNGSGVAFSHKIGGMLQTSSAGVFAIAWAQHISNSNGTTLKIGSSLKLNKVG